MKFDSSNYDKFTISASAYYYSHTFCAINPFQYKFPRNIRAFAMHRGKTIMKGRIYEISNIIKQQELYIQNTACSKC